MEELIGREDVLRTLEESFGKRSAFVVYGRRGIGKTAVLRRFCEGRRSLHLVCRRSCGRGNLDYAARAVSNLTGAPAGPYRDLADALKDIGAVCSEAPTAVVVDGYPWLAESEDCIPSDFQRFIDLELPETDSMLILCGSSVCVMKDIGRNGRGELCGRFRNLIGLKPLTPDQCAAFHPGMGDLDNLLLYLTVGGIPAYHAALEGSTYRECAERLLGSFERILDEADMTLLAEPGVGKHAPAVLSAIGSGAVRQVDIAEYAGIDKAACSRIVDALRDAGFVDRVAPMLGAPRRPVYRISDGFLSFRFGVLAECRHIVENEAPEDAYGLLEERILDHLDGEFAMLCEKLILRSYPVKEIGRWWRDGRNGGHEEIDIVARILANRAERTLLAECFPVCRKAGFGEYRDLTRRARIAGAGNARLMLISPSGFDERFAEFAARNGALLVGMDEIFGRKPMPELD